MTHKRKLIRGEDYDGWTITSPDLKCFWADWTATTRRGAINRFSSLGYWRNWYRRGYRCVRIKLVEIKL